MSVEIDPQAATRVASQLRGVSQAIGGSAGAGVGEQLPWPLAGSIAILVSAEHDLSGTMQRIVDNLATRTQGIADDALAADSAGAP